MPLHTHTAPKDPKSRGVKTMLDGIKTRYDGIGNDQNLCFLFLCYRLIINISQQLAPILYCALTACHGPCRRALTPAPQMQFPHYHHMGRPPFTQQSTSLVRVIVLPLPEQFACVLIECSRLSLKFSEIMDPTMFFWVIHISGR